MDSSLIKSLKLLKFKIEPLQQRMLQKNICTYTCHPSKKIIHFDLGNNGPIFDHYNKTCLKLKHEKLYKEVTNLFNELQLRLTSLRFVGFSSTRFKKLTDKLDQVYFAVVKDFIAFVKKVKRLCASENEESTEKQMIYLFGFDLSTLDSIAKSLMNSL